MIESRVALVMPVLRDGGLDPEIEIKKATLK
jgi:hypothetical protein